MDLRDRHGQQYVWLALVAHAKLTTFVGSSEYSSHAAGRLPERVEYSSYCERWSRWELLVDLR